MFGPTQSAFADRLLPELALFALNAASVPLVTRPAATVAPTIAPAPLSALCARRGSIVGRDPLARGSAGAPDREELEDAEHERGQRDDEDPGLRRARPPQQAAD